MLKTDSLQVRRGVSQSTDATIAARELFEAISQPEMAFALFYCSADYDLDVLGAELKKHFEGVSLIGCTTAGEITPAGYLSGSLTGVSIASSDLVASSVLIDEVSEFDFQSGETVANAMLNKLRARGLDPAGNNTFGFLLIDGTSKHEELVVSAIYKELGDIELFGGSAADSLRFQTAYTYYDGKFRTDSAVFTLVYTNCPFTVFRAQHFVSTGKKMVVTEADPVNRTVSEINGEPAAREYARTVGLNIDKLEPTIFATHPVMVRVGGEYFVRSIMTVNDDESLTFACAIDEGIVLTVAQAVDLVDNLKQLFSDVREKIGPPQLVLGCDCLFRMIEMEQKSIKEQVGEICKDNNVVGFSTYGEQYNAMHVNQTFTGVAIGMARENE